MVAKLEKYRVPSSGCTTCQLPLYPLPTPLNTRLIWKAGILYVILSRFGYSAICIIAYIALFMLVHQLDFNQKCLCKDDRKCRLFWQPTSTCRYYLLAPISVFLCDTIYWCWHSFAWITLLIYSFLDKHVIGPSQMLNNGGRGGGSKVIVNIDNLCTLRGSVHTGFQNLFIV